MIVPNGIISRMLIAFWARNSGVHYNPPPQVFWLVWGGFLGFFILLIWAAARAKRKRREALEQFALESGFAFSAEADAAIAEELAPIQASVGMAAMGAARYANILRGSREGREVVIADRSVGQGKSQSTTTVIATKFETPLAPFSLCTENFLMHVVEKFGYKDIDLESAPEFSQRFFLHSDKPDEVRALFTSDVTAAFEQLPQDAFLCVQAGGNWLTVYRGARLTQPDQLRGLVDMAGKIADALHRGQQAGVKW